LSFPLNLALFRNRSDAITFRNGGYLVSDELAIARAPEVSAPSTVSMSVPALEAGIYFLLGQDIPNRLYALLVVQ
jgi:hypothetical protein